MTKRQALLICKELGLNADRLLDMGDGLFSFVKPINITPAMALEWLTKFNTDNRDAKKHYISRIANDIMNDWWNDTHQGIAFRGDGQVSDGNRSGLVLGDGQNRLMGIVRANKPAQIRVFLGLTKSAMLAIDGNAPRTIRVSLGLQGHMITQKRLSALKFFLGGRKGETTGLSPEAVRDAEHTWKDELDFSFATIPPHIKNITAGVRAAIMRAYHVNESNSDIVDKIKAFSKSLVDGLNITSRALTRFRTDLGKQGYGGQGRKAIYAYTEDVLRHYLFDSPNSRLRESAEEVFPLAWENQGELV